MRFTPLSDEEAVAQSADLWQDGTYDYEIREASEETSAAGNEMIKLEAWVYNLNGDRRLVFDYLVSSEKAGWKVHAFAASCGLAEQYKSGNLMVADIVGRTGRCQIGTQKATDSYPAKNVIRNYIKAKDASAAARPQSVSPRKPVHAGSGSDLDDEIPF